MAEQPDKAGQTLAALVRAKYPGAYDDLSDVALEQQVRGKFPGVYDDIPSVIAAGAHPEAKIGASASPVGMPGRSLPPDRLDAAGMPKVVAPEVEQFMRTPLARPTGVDAIDSFLSPASLAQIGATEAGAIKAAVGGLMDRIGGAATKKLVKVLMPSVLKKPAEVLDLLAELTKAAGKGEAPPAQPPAPAAAVPAPAGAVPPPTQVVPPAQPPAAAAATAGAPAAAPPTAAAQPSATPLQPPAAAPISEPAAAPAKFQTQKALNELALAARRGKVGQLSGAEYQQGLDLVRAGKTPQQALEAVVAQRPPTPAIEQLASMPGFLSDAQVAEREAARLATGKIKSTKFRKDSK